MNRSNLKGFLHIHGGVDLASGRFDMLRITVYLLNYFTMKAITIK